MTTQSKVNPCALWIVSACGAHGRTWLTVSTHDVDEGPQVPQQPTAIQAAALVHLVALPLPKVCERNLLRQV